MTQSTPARPGGPPATPDRLFAAADALRNLVELFTDREVDDDLVDETLQLAGTLSSRLAQAAPWDRQAELAASLVAPDTEEGRRLGFPHRAIAGGANPCATPMTLHFGEGVVTTEVTFGARHGGAPGRVHGGALAGVFDEFAGAAPRLVGAMAATARLAINYRAPIPVGEPLVLRVWVDHQEGRKIFVHGDARRRDGTADDRELIADIEALFITIDYTAIDTSGAARH